MLELLDINESSITANYRGVHHQLRDNIVNNSQYLNFVDEIKLVAAFRWSSISSCTLIRFHSTPFTQNKLSFALPCHFVLPFMATEIDPVAAAKAVIAAFSFWISITAFWRAQMRLKFHCVDVYGSISPSVVTTSVRL